MLIVKKFGGTSVANKERIFNVAGRCIEEYKKGNDVVVVLSAMGKYTDELITMAKDINEKPPKREMDMLFTIGEQMSVALMSMAFDKLGVPSVSLNAFQVASILQAFTEMQDSRGLIPKESRENWKTTRSLL